MGKLLFLGLFLKLVVLNKQRLTPMTTYFGGQLFSFGVWTRHVFRPQILNVITVSRTEEFGFL